MISKSYQQVSTEAFGYNEKSDCTVRAYAIAAEINYIQAHTELLIAGRKNRKGFHIYNFYTEKFGKPIPRQNMSVERFILFFCQQGNWILQVTHHVFAVTNGVTHDWRPNGNQHVLNAWRVK